MVVTLPNETDLMNWLIFVEGPAGTPYKVKSWSTRYVHHADSAKLFLCTQGGTFRLHLNFPTDYPFKPPTFSWETKIYHPNVTNDGKGSMCLGILKPSEWKPSSKIDNALEFVRQLLIEPDVENAVEASIAEELTKRPQQFRTEAEKWTKKYAKST